MWKTVCLLGIMLFFVGCGPVQHSTRYEGVSDPGFDLAQVETIGITPYYWTEFAKQHGIDQLTEKHILHHVKEQLEERGFHVEYISKEHLKEVDADDEEGRGEVHCFGMDQYPDLTCSIGYCMNQGSVTVPAQHGGYFSVGPYGGSGWSRGHSAYDVTVWTNVIVVGLWAGPPEYLQEVWRGTAVQGSSQPDLPDKAKYLVGSLFSREFPQTRKRGLLGTDPGS